MKTRAFQKVVVVGIGIVGSAVAYGLVNQGLCNEVILINRNKEKAIGLALDLRQSMEYMQRNMHVWAGDYSDCSDADIVIVCLGSRPKENRFDYLETTFDMVRTSVERVMESGFQGFFINLTNPVDVISHYIYKVSGLPASHVIGTGTALDSARLKSYLSEITGVAPRCIEAYTIGEHGDSLIIPWSTACIGGKSLKDYMNANPERFRPTDKDLAYGSVEGHILAKVKRAGWQIQEHQGYTCYGVASAALGIARSILRDECTIIPCSVMLDGEYGVHDVFASTPCILSADGVCEVIELHLTPDEEAGLLHSIDVIRDGIAQEKL